MRRFLGALAILLAGTAALVPGPVKRASHISEGDVRFKTTCNFDHAASDDPIVFPNQPGAAHLHDFTGRIGVTASTTTYDELLLGRTTCNDSQDLAAYWTPAVFINGVKRDPVRTTAYYRRGSKDGTIRAYPDGLKIIAGHSLTDLSAPAGRTGWQCNEAAPPTPTPGDCTTDLTMRVQFPDCWDGKSTDSADHRSHMAYSTYSDRKDANVCPRSHRVQVPQLTTYTHYGEVPAGATITLSSGDVEHGVHGDFFNGWVRVRLIERIDTCLNQLQRCESGG